MPLLVALRQWNQGWIASWPWFKQVGSLHELEVKYSLVSVEPHDFTSHESLQQAMLDADEKGKINTTWRNMTNCTTIRNHNNKLTKNETEGKKHVISVTPMPYFNHERWLLVVSVFGALWSSMKPPNGCFSTTNFVFQFKSYLVEPVTTTTPMAMSRRSEPCLQELSEPKNSLSTPHCPSWSCLLDDPCGHDKLHQGEGVDIRGKDQWLIDDWRVKWFIYAHMNQARTPLITLDINGHHSFLNGELMVNWCDWWILMVDWWWLMDIAG